MTLKITLSGEPLEVADGTTVTGLLTLKKVDNPQVVVVSVNGQFVDRNAYDTTPIKDGDAVEFIYFMGGGR